MKSAMKSVKKFMHEADMFLFFTCLLASLYGLLLVISAVHSTSNPIRPVIVQSAAIVIGIFAFVLISLVDIYDILDQWKLILVFNILFVVSTRFLGTTIGGNRSWIVLPFIGVQVQPAEIVKITYIMLLAKQMYTLKEHLSRIPSMMMLVGHTAMMVGLIWFAAGDIGMIVVYLFIFLFMLFASGAMLVWFFAAAGAVAAAAPLVWNHLGEYQKMRILVVLDETLDPLGYGWQAARCKLAIGGGKIFGQGLFNGTQTQHGILPAKETDCIFAVAGEELGMIGCIVIILLLLTIIIRCFYVASRARNGMGSLICVGIASMLIFQTLENIGMCLGVTPVIGITLPFFSYGGTSIVTMYVAMGIISSIKMRPLPDWLRSSEEYY